MYKLYIKGADSIIKSRLSTTKAQPFLEKTNDYLTQFSLIGLRTLMMAMRVMSEAEYLVFKKNLTALSDSPNRDAETGKQRRIDGWMKNEGEGNLSFVFLTYL